MVRRHDADPVRSARTVASASTPAWQSSGVGVLGRGVADPGRVADEQHRRRRRRRRPGSRRRGRRRSAAPARRRAGRRAGPAAPPWKTTSGVQDSTTASVPAAAATSATTARTSASSAPRASSQARTRDGIALVPLGCTSTRPIVATVPCSVGCLAGAQHRRGQPEHRVVAVHEPGGAGVVGLAGQVEPPPAVRPDAVGDPDRRAAVHQVHALLDVQLDAACRRGAASRRPGRGGPGRARRRASPRPASCRRASARPRAWSGSSAPVSSREPAQAMPNRAPSSSVKLTTASGRAGTCPRSRSRSTAANPPTTPSGPSNAPPSGTESRWLPVTTPGPSASGSPHHAHWLPLRSTTRSSPRRAASAANHSRQARSAGAQACRR